MGVETKSILMSILENEDIIMDYMVDIVIIPIICAIYNDNK